ncbi:MAG: c-type cytochrome domain-containing protein, partial [Verrucomicrobiota bacterium]
MNRPIAYPCATIGLLLAGLAQAQAEEKIDFATQIYPFVKGSCAKCHQPTYQDERGRARRPKSDLVVTNKEDFLKGGEGGVVLVAGKPDESEFLHRTLLPLDDDDHQPPEGKAPQWTTA